MAGRMTTTVYGEPIIPEFAYLLPPCPEYARQEQVNAYLQAVAAHKAARFRERYETREFKNAERALLGQSWNEDQAKALKRLIDQGTVTRVEFRI